MRIYGNCLPKLVNPEVDAICQSQIHPEVVECLPELRVYGNRLAQVLDSGVAITVELRLVACSNSVRAFLGTF